MVMKDLYHNLLANAAEATGNQCIASQTLAASAEGTGQDLRGYRGALAIVDIGDSAGTPTTTNKWSIILMESDDNSTFTVVADADIQGDSSSGVIHVIDDATTKDNITISRGYIGSSRYLTVYATKAASGPNQPLTAVILKGYAEQLPVV